MAKITEGLALVIGEQSAEGTVETVAKAATEIVGSGSLTGTEGYGLLLRKDSLNIDFERIEEETEDRAGTFTKKPGDFLRENIPTFQFSLTAKGSGQTTTTPVAGEFDLAEPIEILLRGLGLLKGTGTGTLTPYELGEPSFLTFKFWRRDNSWTIQDCRVNSAVFNVEGGNLVSIDFDIAAGTVDLFRESAHVFPTVVDYLLQETTPPPIMKAASTLVAARSRGFLTGTLAIRNSFSPFPDSNATNGISFEREERRIEWDGRFYADSTETDQDRTNLLLTADPTVDLEFQLGVDAVAGGVANALKFLMKNLNLTKQTLVEDARRVIWDLSAYATDAGSGDDEFLIESR